MIYVGSDTNGIIKTDRKIFCRDTIEKFAKDSLEGSYIVFRSNPILSRGRPKISTGYMYKNQKVLSYIVT